MMGIKKQLSLGKTTRKTLIFQQHILGI